MELEYFGGRTQYLESIPHDSAVKMYFKDRPKGGRNAKGPHCFKKKQEKQRERRTERERKRVSRERQSPISRGG